MSGPEVIRSLGPWYGRPIRDILEVAIANLVLSSPSLSVGIDGEETSAPCFVALTSLDLLNHFDCVESTATDANPLEREATLRHTLEALHDQLWPDVSLRPPWQVKAIVYPQQSDGKLLIDVVFSLHHALGDGRSTAVFHTKLLNELNSASGRPSQLTGYVLHVSHRAELVRPQEELVKFTKSWPFLIGTLWRTLGPTWLRGPQPTPAWSGKPVSQEPFQTRLRFLTITTAAVPRLLSLCRAHGTTLTPLLHALTLAFLSRRLLPPPGAGFCSGTPIDLRPFVDGRSRPGSLGGTMGVFVTSQSHKFEPDRIAGLRQGDQEDEIWKVAMELRQDQKKRLASLPRDDIMSMLGWVRDWHKYWLNMVGKPRSDTWEVSNIGSMAGGHGEVTGAPEGWKIQRSIMTQGAAVAGPAFKPFGGGSSSSRMGQARAKSTTMRPHDQGVVVRLLQDIPKFGRKDAIFRIERGRMRNEWFPNKKAEYITSTRFRELGLTRQDVGERDRSYTAFVAAPMAEEPPLPAEPPEKAHTLLSALVPETLTFHRRPIYVHAPVAATPPPSVPPTFLSPLIASVATSPAQEAPDQEPAALAIFGSVSTTDIVARIKSFLTEDLEASRIALEPGSIRFVGLEENRVKTLGHWEVEISVGLQDNGLEPVRKMVEILPAADGQAE
ncbi:hypothetical protein B0T17DRAFT_588338 [Bombardia bombarda]|uniref:Ribosomal protein L9 domain-containing protein n=1 Tax=Bombardia bombarda TaxID=252184 RepID=A0AA39X6E5_9PEZI|nr:hypothetical protein B0T17DRAFT_588338 [Bombardia bombarda]